MEYIHNRFKKQEKIDIERFVEFSKLFPKNYTITAETEYGCIADVLSQNTTGGTILTELKERNFKATEYEDCFIEVSKWQNLIKLWRTKKIYPFYLNFFSDNKDYYLWDLPTIKKANFHPHVLIYNSELVDRIGLPWEAAYHIHWNGKEYEINKPNKEYVNSTKLKPAYYSKEIFNNKIDNNTLNNL